MPINNCRVCGNKLIKEPLLHYKNMPKSAQFLPDEHSLKGDTGIELKVCQCSGCGLVQLKNDPVSYYKEVIRASAFSDEMKEFRIKQFGNFIEKYSLKGKKIIEIGCGRGEYLNLMRQSGAHVYGLEYSPESVAQCKKNGLNVSRGFIESASCRLKDSPFDAFFTLNYFEHLPFPNDTLRGINNNLTDNAIGLIEVPNFNMILQKKLFSEFTSDHLLYFTKETLNTSLILNGFEVIEIDEVWHNYIISSIVRKRKKLDITGFYNHQLGLKNEIENYIKNFGKKRVAIWGAGHQALAIISLFELADKIRYVVDSAVFKQGKYTPSSHIPIVSPEMLEADPVEAVIVMAAGYSDEVARILRQKFDKNINIAILRDYGLEVLRT